MMNYRQLIATLALAVGATFMLAAGQARAAKGDGEVGRYEGPAGVLVLTTLVEGCQGGMKAFFGAHAQNGPFTGCYVVLGDRVLVEFEDGSVGFMPLSIFKLKSA